MSEALIRPDIEKAMVDIAIDEWIQKLFATLDRKGYGTFASSHEILGDITEEYNEFLATVQGNLAPKEKIAELQDIAIGAIFGIACLMSGKMDEV